MGWTLQALIDGDISVAAFCRKCDHNALLDLVALRDMRGADAPAMADDLKQRLRCTACGSREMGLTYTPSGNYRMANVNRFARAKGV